MNASRMVILSNASEVNTSHNNESNVSATDFKPMVKQLHNDTKFLSQLQGAEYSFWGSKFGIWHSDRCRGLRQEYAEEEEYLKNKWSTGVSNFMKRGWEWIWRENDR